MKKFLSELPEHARSEVARLWNSSDDELREQERKARQKALEDYSNKMMAWRALLLISDRLKLGMSKEARMGLLIDLAVHRIPAQAVRKAALHIVDNPPEGMTRSKTVTVADIRKAIWQVSTFRDDVDNL